ncbi:MAG: hypothetical protein ABGZ49_16855, partial [Akkermansiaceae bacterium]
MNWVLILTMYGLLVFGVLSIESAARHIPHGDLQPEQWGPFFAGRQKLWIVLGSVVYFAAALIDYRWLKWLGIPMYFVGIVMLFILMAKGSEVHQLTFGGINLEDVKAPECFYIEKRLTEEMDIPVFHDDQHG